MAADLKNGRGYIPESDLASVGLKPEDLLNQDSIRALRPVIEKWQRWGLNCLDRSEPFVYAVPKTDFAMRAAVIWPVYWSADTMEAVSRSNPLDSSARPRISRRRIYSTIASTPPLLLSNTAFTRGYRFRRETLMLSMSTNDNGGKI